MLSLLPILPGAIATTALVLMSVSANPTQAVPVTYDFTVNVTQGSLSGKSFTGTFRYDDTKLKGTGIEELGVAQGLTVCMNFLGRHYSAKDDSNYPAFPKLVFDNGQIKQLDFWIEPGKRLAWWNLPGWEVKTSRRPTAAGAEPACQ